MSTPGRIGFCLECLPIVNNLPHCRMMDFTLFGNGLITLPRLMTATIAYNIADVFSLWHCVNTHLKASDQQTAKTSALKEVLTLADDLINMS